MIKLLIVFLLLNNQKEGDLHGYWRMYRTSDGSFECTLFFKDSIVYEDIYSLGVGNVSGLKSSPKGIYFNYSHFAFVGYPKLRFDTLYIEIYENIDSDTLIETLSGVRDTKISPIDVYEKRSDIEMDLPESSFTIHTDSVWNSGADILIGRSKINNSRLNIGKGDYCIQVNDVLIKIDEINEYLQDEENKHINYQEEEQVKKPFVVRLHVSKSIPKDLLSSILRETNLKNQIIYRAYYDIDEKRIGYKLIDK
jgi:hypothetical protein